MKEATFLKKNQARWKELEDMLAAGGRKDPDKLSGLFIQLTDDLSYARTYYPDSKATQYLNFLSSQLHQEIYKNKKEKGNRFTRFWAYEVPMAVGKHIELLFISFLTLLVGVLLGWVTQVSDPEFVRFMLSDAYVNMTETNIANGKPMNVYAEMSQVSMFFMIMFNNIWVSFLYFLLGFFAGIGSLWRIFSEAIRIGSFLCFFYQRDYIGDAMMALWMHGTIEISIIVISGQAGMMLGKGMLFPGSYPRLHSFISHAKDALKIVVGLVPFFILAAFIESFLTRLYYTSALFSLSVILLSLGMIVSYFVVYPLILRRNYMKEKMSLVGAEDLVLVKKANHKMYGYLMTGSGVLVILISLLTGYTGAMLVVPALQVVYGLVRLYAGYRQNNIMLRTI